MINDLLEVSRIITGKLRLEFVACELHSVIEAAAESIRPTAEARGVRLQVLLEPHVGPVFGDRERLQQVVWNLLSNGVKFTRKGGLVQVTLQRINSHVEIVVNDTGIGINPDFLPHVFDRFGRRMVRRRETTVAWVSGSRSYDIWWNCTAARRGPRVPERTRARVSPSGCR